MDSFFRGAAGILLTVILILALGKQGKETGLLLSILVCCMVGILAVSFLQPVVTFWQKLQETADLEPEMLRILLKVVGVALTTELGSLVCTDAGNGALGKMLQYLGSAVVLWLSLPMFTALLELVEGILGGL